jgi:hypothetical protein
MTFCLTCICLKQLAFGVQDSGFRYVYLLEKTDVLLVLDKTDVFARTLIRFHSRSSVSTPASPVHLGGRARLRTLHQRP